MLMKLALVGKVQRATFLCKHRYTGKLICAVPCDGEDDFCEDFKDENCQVSPFVTTIILAAVLLIVTMILSEPIFRNHSKSINLDKDFLFRNHDSSYIKLSEHNVKNLHLFKKKYSVFTNLQANFLINLIRPGIFERFKYSRLHYRLQSNLKVNICFIYFKNTFRAIIEMTLYYTDTIKDLIFIVIPANVLLSTLSTFDSFGAQIFYLMWISIIFPWVVNFFFLLTKNPFQSFKSRTVRITFAILSPFAPGISIFMRTRYRMHQEILILKYMHKSSPRDMYCFSQIHEHLEKEICCWSKTISLLKLNEVTFENLIQSTILIVVILLKFTKTATVLGLHELFAGGDLIYIAFSAIWSIISMMFAPTNNTVTSKNGFLPPTGKLTLILFNILSIISRTVAIIVYFSPALGLMNLLQHHKFGSLPLTLKKLIYDVNNNGTIILFKEAWNGITSYDILTLFSLTKYYIVFLFMIGVHYASVTIIKLRFAIDFGRRQNTGVNFINILRTNVVFSSFFYVHVSIEKLSKQHSNEKFVHKMLMKLTTADKIFHVLSQLQWPSSYKDWDEDDDSEEGYKDKFKKVLQEMKCLLVLFTTEHILMCIPMWILSYSIATRNIYLSKYFSIIEEEMGATNLAYTLSACCPVFFIATSCAQYGLFVLYHKRGHPWSKLLFPVEETA